MDFGAGAMRDTVALAGLLRRPWRVIAVEPYGPGHDATRLADAPSHIEIVRRNFLLGNGLAQKWWTTSVDMLYARRVWCALRSEKERENLWAFVSRVTRDGSHVFASVSRAHEPFDDDATLARWIDAFRTNGFTVLGQERGGGKVDGWVHAVRKINAQ